MKWNMSAFQARFIQRSVPKIPKLSTKEFRKRTFFMASFEDKKDEVVCLSHDAKSCNRDNYSGNTKKHIDWDIVATPPKLILINVSREREISVFTTFAANMDASVKNMVKVCSDQTQKYQTHLKREYSTIGKSFQQLGESMQLSGANNGKAS